MSRISAAFRSFFFILFKGVLPDDIAARFGFVRKQTAAPAPVKQAQPVDGALQILHVLQRDARLIDFLLEDITPYSDEQIGAAVRSIHADSKASLARHLTLVPVIDAVEGTYQKLDPSKAPDPSRIKLIGNVPANGRVAGGTLRHRGWMVASIDLPLIGNHDSATLAPAELEVE